MPNIRRKSLEYMVAAQKLVDKGMYNSSVHCSYYSRLLQMKYILAHYPGNFISYEVQNEKRERSHEFILEEIKNRTKDFKKARIIVELFRFLKDKRVDADYHDVLFEQEDSLNIIEQSKSLERNLKDQFGTYE